MFAVMPALVRLPRSPEGAVMNSCQTCRDEDCPDHGMERTGCDEWTAEKQSEDASAEVATVVKVLDKLRDRISELEWNLARERRAALSAAKVAVGMDFCDGGYAPDEESLTVAAQAMLRMYRDQEDES